MLRGMRLLERAMLGRTGGRPRPLVASAVALASDAHWCPRCGAACAEPGDSRHVSGAAHDHCSCDGIRGLSGFVRLGAYRPPLDAVLRLSKERGMHAPLRELGRLLGEQVASRLHAPPGGWCVIPVPASPLRRLARGIDHAGELARGVAESVGARVDQPLRARLRTRQAALGREERWSRPGRFIGRRGAGQIVRGRHVLVVDDIRTTGATLDELGRLLRSLGATTVVAAVVAVAERSR